MCIRDRDTAWMEAQKNKLEEMKKTLDEYDYLKLTYLEKFYIRNVNDVELLDYIRILVFKGKKPERNNTVSYTHLRAHETVLDLVCRLLLEKKKTKQNKKKKKEEKGSKKLTINRTHEIQSECNIHI